MHELATNSTKYGALSVDTGRVNVAWVIQHGNQGEELLFEWREAGGPKTSAPMKPGLGLAALNQMAALSFKTSRICAFEPDGFRYGIKIAITHLARAA